MKLLGIAGSLRKNSHNRALLEALERMIPEGMEYSIAAPLHLLPHFNPDLDDADHPEENVRKWREELRNADGIVIASPEYAHAIPGVLKNALDWVVGSGELVEKPVAVLNISPTHLGAPHAYEGLCYTIRLLSARLVEEASFHLGGAKERFDEQGRLTDPSALEMLQRTLRVMKEAMGEESEEGKLPVLRENPLP